MNTTFSRALGMLAMLAAPIFLTANAQTEAAAEADSQAREIPLLTAEQLDELLGPIALYPDALIALMLPAATMPADVVLAARYLGAGGDAAKLDEQPWDESVRSLARYPDVVKWMDEKLSWAIMVGDAFVAQPVDVMQSIQRLRARARAAGTLVDSPEQKVVVEDSNIRIVPAKPEVIYVPVYDPQVVYVPSPSWGWYAPPISYRWCYPTGIWLSYSCDWYNSRVWVVGGSWRHSWYYDRVWCGPAYPTWHRYHDGYYGCGWKPYSRGHYRGWHHDRPTHVVVREGRPPAVVARPRDGDHPDSRRRNGGNYRGGEPRDDRSPDNRSGSPSQPGRRPDSPRVVTQPPRSDVPGTAPDVVSAPNPERENRSRDDGTARRWTGRAGISNPGNPPPVRVVENSAPTTTAPRTQTPPAVRSTPPRQTASSSNDGAARRWTGRSGITNPGNPPPVPAARTAAPSVSAPRSSAPPAAVRSAQPSPRAPIVRMPAPSARPSQPAVSAPPASAQPAPSAPPAVSSPSPRKGDVNSSIRRGEGIRRADRRGDD